MKVFLILLFSLSFFNVFAKEGVQTRLSTSLHADSESGSLIKLSENQSQQPASRLRVQSQQIEPEGQKGVEEEEDQDQEQDQELETKELE